MSSNSNSSSSGSSDSDDQNRNSNPRPNLNTDSLDQSLDALQNQLASVSLSSRQRQTTASDDKEVEKEEELSVEQLTITNGPLNEEIGTEGAVDSIEDELKSNGKAESSGVIKESSSYEWTVLSPSSSGCAGERGSTTGGDETKGGVEGKNVIHAEVGNDGVSGSQEQWPCDYRVKLVRAGKHQVVFLVKGPIYLVCISCTEEPYESLMGQLELLYGQMILILTKSINRRFEKNPKFDMTSLLGGTDAVFSSLIHSFSWNPATFLHAYSCLPLAYATRQAAVAILQDVAGSGVLFALLMCRHKVISLVGAQKASLHPDDILLLSNFVMSSESFRTFESFSPVCLPRYNPLAFLYAYVNYFDIDTFLILLTTSSEAFYHLKDSRIRIETVLLKSNVLSEVQRSMVDGGMLVEDLPIDPTSRAGTISRHLGQPKPAADSPGRTRDASIGIGGPAGLWHFIYRSIYLDQYASSKFSSPINSLRQQKRLYRAYQRLYASMHDKGIGPHKTYQDFHLLKFINWLKALAIKTCNQVCRWVKDVENEIFLLGASPFSW
ncbi:hypothetical protein Pfo_018094 [Paulownia fortunei]|nr:hypothetical protein Pfo_018094 [Paulownia fortunei]